MRKLLLSACIVWLMSFSIGWAAPVIPALTDPVMDQAGLLQPQTRQYLNRELRRLHDSGGSQIAILILPKLDGETIEGLSIKVAEQWKLGSATKDNGVLLLMAAEDRKFRIDVGQGNEGVLTDVQSSRIVRQQIMPLFKAGDFDNGIMLGVASVISLTDPSFTLAQGGGERQVRRERNSGGKSALPMIIFIIVVLIVLISNRRGGGGGGFGAGLAGGFIGGFG
ncbi:MAG: TPM domain-containing protein, partial [Proteobacteria bacterium]